jgi:uncharacterized membrane protein YdfJ with MMPL/SSD domain
MTDDVAVSIGIFGTSDIFVLKILGLGTALAVLVDALLVRCLLLPASLRLLSPRIRWVPPPLTHLHDESTCTKRSSRRDSSRFPSQRPPNEPNDPGVRV